MIFMLRRAEENVSIVTREAAECLNVNAAPEMLINSLKAEAEKEFSHGYSRKTGRPGFIIKPIPAKHKTASSAIYSAAFAPKEKNTEMELWRART